MSFVPFMLFLFSLLESHVCHRSFVSHTRACLSGSQELIR
jgi:hypothetical protein